MVDFLITFCLGILGGFFAGVTPGVPITLGFLLFLPLIQVDAFLITMYAIQVGMGTQFFGSQAVLYYKIPGESSSFPTMLEIKNFNTPEKIRNMVQITAWGSLVASIFALFILGISLVTDAFGWVRMPIEVKSLLFLILILVAIGINKKYFSNFLILLLSTAICFYEDIAPITDFMPTYYFNGFLGVIIIFAMQLVWNKPKKINQTEIKKGTKFNFKTWFPFFAKYSVIGSFFGFIPQLGTTLGSFSTYLYEKRKGSNAVKRVAAAETSNNTSIIIHWLPLFLFGVPITTTEIMLVSHFNIYQLDFEFLNDKAIMLVTALLASAVVYTGLCLTTNKIFYNTLAKVISNYIVSILLAFTSVFLFYFIGDYTMNFLLVHLLLFVPISLVIHKLNVNLLTVTIGLILSEQIIFTFYQLLQIYRII